VKRQKVGKERLPIFLIPSYLTGTIVTAWGNRTVIGGLGGEVIILDTSAVEKI